MLNRIAVLLFVFAFIAAAAWLARPTGADEPVGEEQKGAFHALVQWGLQRAYPGTEFPSRGYMAAFHQRQALAASSFDGGSAWEPMGPTNEGGRTLAIAINQDRPESIWLGSAGGGLWRSYNAGLDGSWHRVATGFPVTSAATVAVADTDTNVVYLGTGEVYRYQDTRGGVMDRPTRAA